MANNGITINEILEVANSANLQETGGGHNQKGVDFQRYWALMRIFQVESSGQDDFLFLFEAIQDIAEFDSSLSPSTVTVYQVKKKDRGEWEWNDLTGLPSLKRNPSKTVSQKQLTKSKSSPLGKLYAATIAFTNIKSRGHFISNAGCNFPLVGGGNAATSVPCTLASLDHPFRDLMKKGLELIHKTGIPAPDLDRLKIERVPLHPDSLSNTVVGEVTTFLNKRSPRHRGQAQTLVDSLMAIIGPLGRRTDRCNTFDEMKERHGFLRQDLISALGDLEEIPDLLEYMDRWLQTLANEGITAMELTAIRMAASAYFSRQVMGAHTRQEQALVATCDEWLKHNTQNGTLSEFFNQAHAALSLIHPRIRRPEILAIFALRAIKKCVDQT
jgi:Cap4 dsDNA endonuclease